MKKYHFTVLAIALLLIGVFLLYNFAYKPAVGRAIGMKLLHAKHRPDAEVILRDWHVVRTVKGPDPGNPDVKVERVTYSRQGAQIEVYYDENQGARVGKGDGWPE